MPSGGEAAGVCAGTAGVGAGVGALVGLSLGIWALVRYVEPAFEKTHGINEEGAKALTALVGLAGGLEATTGAGAVAGLIAGPCIAGLVVAMLACCYCFGSGVANNTPSLPRVSTNRATMYATTSRAVETRAAAAVVAEVVELADVAYKV